MTPGVIVLLAAVVTALALGAWWRARQGKFATSRPDERPEPEAAALVRRLGEDLGERATLLQFSSAFCAPCRATRVVLADVAGAVPGVRHVEVDAEQHLDAVRALNVLRTPTTIVLDRTGREVTRAGGAPTREQVLTALAGAVSHDTDGRPTS